jgi:WD40 repeat protein
MSGPGITPYGGHAGQVLAVAYAPDGGTLASGDDDGTVRIWDARTASATPRAIWPAARWSR